MKAPTRNLPHVARGRPLIGVIGVAASLWLAAPIAAQEPRAGPVTDRLEAERPTAFNPYVLNTHKANFVLPVSYTNRVNRDAYDVLRDDIGDTFQHEEVQFQLSVKSRLNPDDLLVANDGLFVGFTLESWWQLYNKELSSPFRETNYQPEIFYLAPGLPGPFGGNTSLGVGFEHQSNGQVPGLSRSWNRLYAMIAYERDNLVLSLRPWYRLPEDDKETPLDPKGDDNPDIDEYFGNAELQIGWRGTRYEILTTLHGNPSTGNGGIDIKASYPLFGRIRGLVSYFDGYGDSLLDYDHYQRRVGIGLMLSNLF